jgi:hypothetical protein
VPALVIAAVLLLQTRQERRNRKKDFNAERRNGI